MTRSTTSLPQRGQGVLKEMARLRHSRGELLLELVEEAEILVARQARP